MKKISILIIIIIFIQIVNGDCALKSPGKFSCNENNITIALYEMNSVEVESQVTVDGGYYFDSNTFPFKTRVCDQYIGNILIYFTFGIHNIPKIPTYGGQINFGGDFIFERGFKLKPLFFLINGKKNDSKYQFDNDTSTLYTTFPQGCGYITLADNKNININASYQDSTFIDADVINNLFILNGTNLNEPTISITPISNSEMVQTNFTVTTQQNHNSLILPFEDSKYQGSYMVNVSVCQKFNKTYTYTFLPELMYPQNVVVQQSGGLVTFLGRNLKVRNDVTAKFGNYIVTCIKDSSNYSAIQCNIPSLNGEYGYNINFNITFDGKYTTKNIPVSYDLPLINKVVQKIQGSNVFEIGGVHFNQVSSVGINKVNGVSKLLTKDVGSGYYFVFNNDSSLTVTVPFDTQPGYMALGIDGTHNASSFFSPGYNLKIIPTVSTPPLKSDTVGQILVINGTFLRTVDFFGSPIPLTIMGSTVDGSRKTSCINFSDGDGYSFHCLMSPGIGVNYTLKVMYNNNINVGSIPFSYNPPTIDGYVQQPDGSILISGRSLGNDPLSSFVRIMFSGQTITAKVVSSNHVSMQFVLPSNAPRSGEFNVNVITDSVNQYAYTIRPVISNVTSIPCSGGNVTINGHYFFGYQKESTYVSIGKQNCVVSDVSVDSIICYITPSSFGQSPYSTSGANKEIVVQGGSGTLVVYPSLILFNYLPPFISNFSTISTESFILTIYGNSFSDFNLYVSINGSECRNPVIIDFPDSKTITCVVPDNVITLNVTDTFYPLLVRVDGQTSIYKNFTYFFVKGSDISEPKSELFPPVIYIGIVIFALFLVFIYFQVHFEIIKYRKAKRAKKLFEASEARRLLIREKFKDKINYKFIPTKVPKAESKVVKFLKKKPLLKRLFKKSFEEPLEDVNVHNIINQTNNDNN